MLVWSGLFVILSLEIYLKTIFIAIFFMLYTVINCYIYGVLNIKIYEMLAYLGNIMYTFCVQIITL